MNQIDWHDYLDGDSAILGGKPIIKGTRLSVEHILGLFASGWTWDEVFKNYPELTKDEVRAAFHYTREAVQDDRLVTLRSRPAGWNSLPTRIFRCSRSGD